MSSNPGIAPMSEDQREKMVGGERQLKFEGFDDTPKQVGNIFNEVTSCLEQLHHLLKTHCEDWEIGVHYGLYGNHIYYDRASQ